MSNTNTAAWLKEVNRKFDVSETDLYIPAAGELLIENRAVASNPVDWMNQDGHYPPKSVPAILGNDLAGIVVQLGEGVHGFKEGQRVLAHSNAWADGDIRHGPFQKFVAVPAMSASQIPDSMEFAEAASLPLALSTAAIGLFSQAHLALPLPSAHVAAASTKALLVWGGSSSVGTAAIQLAKAAGLEVLVVTSAKNAKVAQQLGATMVYDYNSATVVEDLIKDAKQYDIVGAYDAISSASSQSLLMKVLIAVGGGRLALTLPPIDNVPSSVQVKQVFAGLFTSQFPEVAQYIYGEFLPAALSSSQLKPALQVEIVGHGLDAIQDGVDRVRKGVSATKIVVTL